MKNILDYLEKTVGTYPDRIAVDDGTQTLTWQELREFARRYATTFAVMTKTKKPVAIFAEKSAVTLAAMFGVVYAGCFYVMIDPSQPPSRVEEIMNVLEPELAIVQKGGQEILQKIGYAGRCYVLDEKPEKITDEKLLGNIREEITSEDILYGIFTSGSTGTPKGIVVSQEAVIRFITHFVEEFGFTVEDRMGNQAPFDFDVSVKDIYTSVMSGARLVLIPRSMFSTPPVLLDFLCEKKVTVLVWAVSALTLVSALKGLKYRVPTEVRKILFSGEVMPIKQLRLWQKALPQTEFVNLYGPSEITCNCTFYRIPELMEEGEKLPIGKAFAGRRVFLLDEEQREITGAGEVGEICVQGESLAQGYYNNEEETRRRFILHEKERCYCTGDLGYLDEEGQFYFSGRKDFQIKHMGHRIELEEIERSMDKIEGLDRSCCIFDEKRQKLVAFYMGTIQPEDIKKQMKEYVPVYMVPHKILQTDHMPLNKNGKTDRNYLKEQLGVK